MSCHGAFDATMLFTFAVNRAGSRARRGVASLFFQNPGLTEYENPAWESVATAGPYWCQLSGWFAHDL